MKDCLAFTDKAMDLMLKDPTGKQLEDVLGGLREKRDCLNLCIHKKSQMAAVVRSVGARGFERKKLGDIASGNNGKGLGMEETMNCPGSFPILSGGINYCGTFGKFNRDENTISLSKSGSSSGYVKWNKEKFWASDCFTVHPLNTEVLNNQFLYYSLSLQQENIYRTYQVGGTIPHCYWRDLENLQIPLPPIPIQHEVLAILNEMEAELTTLEQMAAKAEQHTKFILNGYLTPAPTIEAEPITDPNSIAAFIEKHIVHEDGAETIFKKVAIKYKEWCNTRNLQVLTVTELKAALSLVLGDLENDKYKGIKLI